MTRSEVLLELEGAVATITLAAPERRNALTTEMCHELFEACDVIDASPEIGAVVVKANGEAFCAGAHRSILARAANDAFDEAAHADMGAVYGAFVRVGQLGPPTIAAVRGAAVGAGVNLVFATDLRIIAEDARIAPGFLRLGIHPGGGHFALVARAGGRESAVALGVFGEEIDGRRAATLGLAWEALPADAVEGRALELARRAAEDPTLARRVASTMRLELGPPPVPWPVALAAETAAQLWSLRRAGDAGRFADPTP